MADQINAETQAINALLSHVSDQLDATAALRLAEAQAAWTVWRDQEARFAATMGEGGTIGALLGALRSLEIAESRRDYLQAVMDGFD